MQQYILRRIVHIIPVLFLVSVMTFLLMRLLPGDVTIQRLGDQATAENVAVLQRMLGLDQPLYMQYFVWLSHVLKLDLGKSLLTDRPVLDDILQAAPVSIELSLLTVGMAIAAAMPLGLISAMRQNSVWDLGARLLAVLGMALPYFWLGVLVLLVGSLYFRWMPTPGLVSFFDDPLTNITQIGVAALVGCFTSAGIIARMVRSSMLEVFRQDYIRTAWAKGLRERTVMMQHALKNAMIPVVTLIGTQVVVSLGGLVILENIFTLPGMGRLMLTSIVYRDYTLMQGLVLVFSVVVVMVNLAVDLAYGWLDPRIRYC